MSLGLSVSLQLKVFMIQILLNIVLAQRTKVSGDGNTQCTVQPTLDLSSLKDLKLNIPSFEEQKAIAAVLSSLDNKIDLLYRQK